MSAIWRAAVDWHATTLNPAHSLILSLLADSANESGEAKPNIEALAWQGRTDARAVRKAIESFLESGLLIKCRVGVHISDVLIACSTRHCLCPRGEPKDAPGTTQTPPQAQSVAREPKKSATGRDLSETRVLDGTDALTTGLEVRWRRVFKTEPAPGLLRKLAKDLAHEGWDERTTTTIASAFGEYLRRVKDPMYLNLSKFASTWRAYLEPVKGPGKTEDAFSKVFAGSNDANTLDDLSPRHEVAQIADSFGPKARFTNIGDPDL